VQYIVKNKVSGDKLDEEALFQEFLRERDLLVKDYIASNSCNKRHNQAPLSNMVA